MIKVEMLPINVDPLTLAAFAGKICYEGEIPELGQMMNTQAELFEPGHHTTFQHLHLNFILSTVPISGITLGLHYDHPFYNSSQRSGRYCSDMFTKERYSQALKGTEKVTQHFWPSVSDSNASAILDYMDFGVQVFLANKDKGAEIAREYIKEERPFISDKTLDKLGPKIAQEQLRNFIAINFPTALLHTINLSVVADMYRVAWTPVMRDVFRQMAEKIKEQEDIQKIVRQSHENLTVDDLFRPEDLGKDDYWLDVPNLSDISVRHEPTYKLLDIFNEDKFKLPPPEKLNPVNLLPYDPNYMCNNLGGLYSRLHMSTATAGQNQRHRTILRGEAGFTGSFYLPPIPSALGLEKEAEKLMAKWIKVAGHLPPTLAMSIVPYGAMVEFENYANFNACLHEQKKRLCKQAQEEISELSRQGRDAMIVARGKDSPLVAMYEPPCYRTGKCTEGKRYCGRDLRSRTADNFFPKRKI